MRGKCWRASHTSVRGSRTIDVSDPDAPIFQVADLCLEAEPTAVLPALLEALGG